MKILVQSEYNEADDLYDIRLFTPDGILLKEIDGVFADAIFDVIKDNISNI